MGCSGVHKYCWLSRPVFYFLVLFILCPEVSLPAYLAHQKHNTSTAKSVLSVKVSFADTPHVVNPVVSITGHVKEVSQTVRMTGL